MKLRPEDLDRWLAAEQAGDDALAENRLTEVFARTPRPAPTSGFAERVILRWRSEARARRPRASLASRLTILACLLLTGLVVSGGLLALPAAFARLGLAELGTTGWMTLFGSGVRELARGLSEASIVTGALADLTRSLVGLLRTPAAAAAGLGLLALGGLTLRWLASWAQARRGTHVQA